MYLDKPTLGLQRATADGAGTILVIPAKKQNKTKKPDTIHAVMFHKNKNNTPSYQAPLGMKHYKI